MHDFYCTPQMLPLPPSPESVSGLYWNHTPAFVDELVQSLQGQRVLEIFGGNGYLAAVLHARGIEVTCTTIPTGLDAHEYGIYHPITPMDAVDAVEAFGAQHDVLLMCWPNVTKRAFFAARLWERIKPQRPIVFIGEYTDYAKKHYGGCATDEFFDAFVPTRIFDSYGAGFMEKACIGTMRPHG